MLHQMAAAFSSLRPYEPENFRNELIIQLIYNQKDDHLLSSPVDLGCDDITGTPTNNKWFLK